MSKKDYILLATAIQSIEDSACRVRAANAIAASLSETNKRFNMPLFIKACTYVIEEKKRNDKTA